MDDSCIPADTDALADMIRRSLRAADRLGLIDVGIFLDKALVQLTGQGLLPG
jgi:hypothetical protein